MSSQEATFQKIPLRLLQVSANNVRRERIAEGVDELAYSMETFGLQQPIVVQPLDGKYEILIGQRRFLAAKQLGWETIDAKVLSQPLSELDARVASFSENAQRRDLTPKDKAETCRYLLDKLGSVRAVAEHLGVSETTVRKWLGYAAVPEAIKEMVESQAITRPAAIRIAENVQDEATAVAIAQRIAEINPAAPERQRILDAVEQYGDRPIDVIFHRAEELKYEKQITFVLPRHWAETIDAASRELSREPNQIARDATIAWLTRFVATGDPD